MNLSEFLASPLRNSWISFRGGQAYVRKAKHYIKGELIDTLDLANISVNLHLQNAGRFREFRYRAEEAADKLGWWVFVENILTDRFFQHFVKVGYRSMPGDRLSREFEEAEVYLPRSVYRPCGRAKKGDQSGRGSR